MAAPKSKSIVIGDLDTLGFVIDWATRVHEGTADEASRGRLLASLDGSSIWCEDETIDNPRGVEWSLVELLEHLTWSWSYLRLEEGDPLDIHLEPPALRAKAEEIWQEIPSSERVVQQRLLRSFEKSHDLAAGFQGLWLPSLWIQRIGVSTQVASGRIKLLLPVKQVMKTLSDLGNEIAKRIQVLDDARAKSAVSSWRKRDSLSPIQFLGASTGLNRARLDAILEGGEVADVFELRRDLEPNDLTAVARMAGRAPAPAETRKLIDLIRMEEKGDMSRLDALSRKASRALRSQKPFDQGSEIARWFRGEILGIDGGERVDPAAELEKLRVRIKNAELSSHVDAVSIWDKKRGPVVFFNTKGKHSQGNAGPRATLAHELCHMLLDRDGALPFAEVMGGSLPRHIEARARAFAAELLLPKDIAGAAFTEGKDPKTVVRRLREKYAVSKEIVAWQAKNSEQHLGADVEAFLRTLVSYPERF